MIEKEDFLKIEGMTEDIAAKAAELSKNDEVNVIKSAQKDVWNGIDSIVTKIANIDKGSTERTSDFAQRGLELLLSRGNKTTKELESIKEKFDKVNKEPDAASKVRIEELEKQLGIEKETISKIRSDYKTLESEKEKSVLEERQKNERYRNEAAFSSIESSLNFKDDLDKDVKAAMIQAKRAELLSFGTMRHNDDGTTIFLGDDGSPLLNADDLQKPFTLRDKYSSSLSAILKEDKKSGGGGGKGGQSRTSFDFTGVSTKEEAKFKIKETLGAQGLVYGTEEYRTKESEMFSSLPKDMPL